MSNRLPIAIVKIAIATWGLISAFQGTMMDAVSNERAPFASSEPTFIGLVYFSVLVGGLFSFVSSRAVSVVLLFISVIAVGIYYSSSPTHDGLGLGTDQSFLLAIVLRPVLAGLILFGVSRIEGKSSP